MIKRTKSISINIISVLIILVCLSLGVLGSTNAWFTDTFKQGVQIEIVVANLNLRVYQKEGTTEREINTIAENTKVETDNDNSTNPQYVSVSGEFEPDVPVGLQLILKNEDIGSASMYVRFKLQMFKRGVSSDVEVPIEVGGNGILEGYTKGFMKVAGDSSGYYYYQDSTKTNVTFDTGETAIMMQNFTVPYTSFIDSAGNMLITGSDTVYLKLTVEASINNDFS